jgi:copper oxidase (laccase) domain-containing protein
MQVIRYGELIAAGRWFFLDGNPDDRRRDGGTCFLSSSSLGSAGRSGARGVAEREHLLSRHHPLGVSGAAAPVCISVSQVHSMDILRIERGEDGVRVISLLEAQWDGISYTELPKREVYRWSEGEFVRRWRELLEIKADGILTNDPRLDLAVTVADCMPIFVRGGAWRALLHSGWAGTGILRRLYGDGGLKGLAGESRAILGPCISAPAYQVDGARADLYRGRFGADAADGRYLDLRGANMRIADELGIRTLVSWDSCTVAHSGLFSYRQDGPDNYSLMLAPYAGSR